MRSFTMRFLAIALVAMMSGCAASTKYYWGSYEDLLYSQYEEPGKATPEYQVQMMEKDIQVASSKNLPLPPGFYAHLAYQYLQTGKVAEARACFETEKKNFPESATLMNRLTKKLK